MSYVVRDPRFSMSLLDAEAPSAPTRYRPSYAKRIERRVVGVWKLVTRSTRKQPRNSSMPSDFIVVTSRRKSTYQPQVYRFRQ
ncbi:hypothetical protein CPB84DRAFT_1770327 [Gymnopilus junonius]|uniref:Uncharacterized protein n=1 Tax=Gymnopilus junonius TaxID=109634 RepID=A0A9P5TPX8_GYMJU|nr:hypothetical protein CPB84DRAFT_1770327 [Gymnopilus junonius]